MSLRLLPFIGIALLVLFTMSEGCICNLIEIGPVLSEKKSFENIDGRQINDLKPRPGNDLDLQDNLINYCSKKCLIF